MAENVNQYEAMFLFPPSGTMELQACLDFAKQMVERHGGQIQVLKKWDERKLAYELGGQKRGLYVICFFKAPGNAVTQIVGFMSLENGLVLAASGLGRQLRSKHR